MGSSNATSAVLAISFFLFAGCATTSRNFGGVLIEHPTAGQTKAFDDAIRPFLSRYDYTPTLRSGAEREYVAHLPPFGLTPVSHHWERPVRIHVRRNTIGDMEITCDGVMTFRNSENPVVNELKDVLARVYRPEQLKPFLR